MNVPSNRVGAMLGVDGDAKVVEFLGYGVCEGEKPVARDAGGLASLKWAAYNDSKITAHLTQEEKEAILLNPMIRLDNGDIVYGCECWWGPEEGIRDQLKRLESEGFELREVRISDFRRDGA